MAFQDAFRDLVLAPLKQLGDTPGTQTHAILQENYGLWPDRNARFNKPMLDRLNRAQGCYSSSEEVLWYCYAYMVMHYDAFLRVIELDEQEPPSVFPGEVFGKDGDLLVIDVGCGPMTSGLAMAEWHLNKYGTPLQMAYIGIDDSQYCRDKAEQFSARRDLFNMEHPATFLARCGDCDVRSLKKKVAQGGTLIFNFSYFFGQQSCQETDLEEIAKFIGEVISVCRVQDNFLVYTNSTWGDRYGKYNLFRQKFERQWEHESLYGAYNKRTVRNLDGEYKDDWPQEQFKHLIVRINPTDKRGNPSW